MKTIHFKTEKVQISNYFIMIVNKIVWIILYKFTV